MHTRFADDVPMTPQLSARFVLAVLAAMLLASAIGLLAMGPVALVPGAPSTDAAWLRALTPWPMMAAATCGLWWAGRVRRRLWRQAWRTFFRAAVVAAVFGLFDAMWPEASHWRLSRIAAGSGYAMLALIFLGERLGPQWIAPRALRLALLAGPLAALIGTAAHALHGQPDERLLLWLEALPLLLLPLGIWGLPSRGLAGSDWMVALVGFIAAKLAELGDARVLAVSQALDGLTLSRWLIAATLLWLGWALLARQPGLTRGASASDAAAARSPSSSTHQRDTSAKTAG